MKYYNKEEIQNYFYDFLADQDEQWIKDNKDDLHYHAFNTDYYIIGTYQAKQWLGDQVFNVIDIIKQYEQDNFGEVSTDLSDPEKVVNMYAYIVGEEIVSNYLHHEELDKVTA